MSSDVTKTNACTIERMPLGGFVVFNAGDRHNPMNAAGGPLYACGKLGEALAFVREQMGEPEKPAQPGACGTISKPLGPERHYTGQLGQASRDVMGRDRCEACGVPANEVCPFVVCKANRVAP